MGKELTVPNYITIIEEINTVILDNELKEVTIFLGNIDCVFINKQEKVYQIALMSGTTIDITDEGAGRIIYKLWLDYLNGNDNSDRLERVVKHTWMSE